MQIEIKQILAIKCCVEMDINTKHLTEWIPIEMIDECDDSALFNGIEIYSMRLGSFYIHEKSASNFRKEIQEFLNGRN